MTAGSHRQCISVRGLFSGVLSQGQSYRIDLNGAGRQRCLVQREIVVTETSQVSACAPDAVDRVYPLKKARMIRLPEWLPAYSQRPRDTPCYPLADCM